MEALEINRKPAIWRNIHRAILNSVDFVVRKCDALHSTPQEPDFIASLTINFSKELFSLLKTTFSTNKFAVTGIYCHQRPLADIGLAKAPEIGDLLFVYIYRNSNGVTLYNSLLLQAKITSTPLTHISKGDQHQLALYSSWPTFTYKRAGKLNGVIRDILPKTINDGAQYLLIDNSPKYGLSGLPGTFPMGCAVPASPLNLNNDLAHEIIDFLKFKSGRTFESKPVVSNDDWSKLIWDLIDGSKGIASRRRNMGLPNFPRLPTVDFDGCCFFSSDTNSIFNDLHGDLGGGANSDTGQFSDSENFAPAMILIECNAESNGK